MYVQPSTFVISFEMKPGKNAHTIFVSTVPLTPETWLATVLAYIADTFHVRQDSIVLLGISRLL